MVVDDAGTNWEKTDDPVKDDDGNGEEEEERVKVGENQRPRRESHFKKEAG